MDFLHHSNHFYVESSNMLFIIFTMTSIDEDIAMLDTSTPSFFPSCNSSPTQLPRHSRIQQTRRQCFDHNFFIRCRTGWSWTHWKGDDDTVILDLVLVQIARGLIYVTTARCCVTYFGPTWSCIESGPKPKLWAPSAFNPRRLSLYSMQLPLSRLGFCLDFSFPSRNWIVHCNYGDKSFYSDPGPPFLISSTVSIVDGP